MRLCGCAHALRRANERRIPATVPILRTLMAEMMRGILLRVGGDMCTCIRMCRCILYSVEVDVVRNVCNLYD